MGSQSSDVSLDRRLTVGSLSVQYCSTMLKLVTVLAFILTIGIGNVWAGTDSKTETFEDQTSASTYNTTYSYDADDSNAGIAWFVEHGCVSTTNYLTTAKSMHMRAYYAKNSASGTWNGNLPYLESRTNVQGLTSITFNAAVSNTCIKMDVMYSTDNGSNWSYMKTTAATPADAKNITLSTSKTSYTYNVPSSSATSNYRIKIAMNSGCTHSNKPSSAGNYTFRVDDIEFTWTAYTVTYNGNSNSSGSVPTDATKYLSGATVTVKSNSGSLAKSGYDFGGWNTNSSGTGTNYTAGSGTFSITSDITLYAKWTEAASCATNPTVSASNNGSLI